MEYSKGMGDVEEDDNDPYQGGGKAVGVWIFLQIRHSVNVAPWCGYVGGHPPQGADHEWFTGPGGAVTDRAAPVAAGRKEVGVHLGGGGKIGGGF